MINSKLCPVLSSKIMSQSKEEVPVILQFNSSSDISNNAYNLSSKIKLKLPLINGFAGYMNTETIYKIVDDPNIEFISFDTKVYALLDIAAPTIDASFPQDKGFHGEGVTIAVVDTGVSPHYDLVRPTNRLIGFKDIINNRTSPYDDNGHGTQVPCTVNQK